MTKQWFTKTSDDASSARPSERTRLIKIQLPSPGSTDRPSQSNLEEYFETEELLVDESTRQVSHLHDDERSNASSLEFFTPHDGIDEMDQEQLERRKGPSSLPSRLLPILGFVTIGVFITRYLHSTGTTVPSGLTKDDTSSAVEMGDLLPLSGLHPVHDMGLFSIPRGRDSYPHKKVLRENQTAVPTHAWYQNFLDSPDNPSFMNRAYVIPHIVDVVGAVPGVQLLPPHIDGTQSVVQLSVPDDHGLTVGAAPLGAKAQDLSHGYSVTRMTNLGVTLKWDMANMTSSIVRGMPFATVEYKRDFDENDPLPAVASKIALLEDPLVDRVTSMPCKAKDELVAVERELQLTFKASGFTWLVFFSEPVRISCSPLEGTSGIVVQVHEPVDPTVDPENRLVVRAAFLNNCTTGYNPIYCRDGKPSEEDVEAYADLLRRGSHLHAGENTRVSYSIPDESSVSTLSFDWDVQNSTRRLAVGDIPTSPMARHLRGGEAEDENDGYITFALQHHLDRMNASLTTPKFCAPTVIGQACLVKGSVWSLDEPLTPVDFRAPRHPKSDFLPDLIQATSEDLSYRLPDYFQRGAGDTYFSGKMLARQARVLLIADEIRDMCSSKTNSDQACDSVSDLLPTSDMDEMLQSLRDGVSIWINGSAEAPFVYDEVWGGLISCGCHFDEETGTCMNKFPDCPSISDPGLNFGNGYYNDHHFHYGYMIYAAATVTHFDPQWGVDNFEAMMLLVRDIANPSLSDTNFPLYRHKDWYAGHSWASGIAHPYLNGKNQESSSEAIAAYEAVALFGDALTGATKAGDHIQNVASELSLIGRVMTATEIRSTDRYWHVRQHDKSKKIYPDMYKENSVGILWNTMAQFQTWFGNAPYLPYGIQLLPITPASEFRDQPDWVREMYRPFADACNDDSNCEDGGWSMLKLAMMASAGHRVEAAERLKNLTSDVFETAGGNGHSRSNTLWYIATRPDVENPVSLPKSDLASGPTEENEDDARYELVNCGTPDTCTDAVLDTDAGGNSCRDRIVWLISVMSQSEEEACSQVGVEYPQECGECKAEVYVIRDDDKPQVPRGHCEPCTEEQCNSDLNRCPIYDRTFVCTEGPSTGGCAPHPWMPSVQCGSCCELSECKTGGVAPGDQSTVSSAEDQVDSLDSDDCPPCTHDVCHSPTTLCPVHEAPFLCTEGLSTGGCAPEPWSLGRQCSECCKLLPDC